jgi:integrase
MRKQNGQIIRIGERWYVRYWERRNIGGTIERKRITHSIGQITTRGKRPPADIKTETERHMATVNSGTVPADRIVTIGDFVQQVYLPWITAHKRPSTAKGYRDIWEDHLKPLSEQVWLKDTRTYHVQSWLNEIGAGKLSRNSLKHVKSVVSGIFTLAKQQDYFQGENPARDSAVNPKAAEAQETYAYTLEEIQSILSVLPEAAATTFAVAAFMGLRHGEIQGLLWENYHGGELFVSRSIWNGHASDPKTRKGRAPVPVIRQLAERLEMHRLRTGTPQKGPVFANGAGNPLALGSLVNRVILPALNRCEICGKSASVHPNVKHPYKRDSRIPEWHGWHAARRGLGSNLYRLGVPEMVIQRILRHANVSTTATYYIKTAADDVKHAMEKLENNIQEATPVVPDTYETQEPQEQATDRTIH